MTPETEEGLLTVTVTPLWFRVSSESLSGSSKVPVETGVRRSGLTNPCRHRSLQVGPRVLGESGRKVSGIPGCGDGPSEVVHRELKSPWFPFRSVPSPGSGLPPGPLTDVDDKGRLEGRAGGVGGRRVRDVVYGSGRKIHGGSRTSPTVPGPRTTPLSRSSRSDLVYPKDRPCPFVLSSTRP